MFMLNLEWSDLKFAFCNLQFTMTQYYLQNYYVHYLLSLGGSLSL